MSSVVSKQGSGILRQGAPLVLIVEDDDAQRRTLAAIIADAGFSPVSFADGDAALSTIESGAYAAAVIDQRLPGTAGTGLISRLRDADPGMRIIVHTAYGSFDSIKESVNLGVFGYVEKGGQPSELLHKLQQAVQLKLSESLRETEQRIAQIYSQANDGIFIIDPSTRSIIDVNHRGASMLGYTPEELTGSDMERIHPHDLPRVINFFRSVMTEGKGLTDEFSCMTKNGRVIPAECSAELIKDGALERVLVIVRDVSERRRAERALQASENQLRLIADNVSAMLAYVDVSHRYRFVNKRFIEFFKVPHDEVLGAHVPDVVGENTYRKLAPYLDRALCGETVTFELQRTSSQGDTRWINATYVPDTDGNGAVRGCFAALHDVTERILAEQGVKDQEAQLRLIADNVSAMLCYVSADYRYQFANRRFADFFGRPVEEILGANSRDIVGEDVFDSIHPYLKRVFAGETVTFEQERRSPVLGPRLIEATLVPDTADDGKVRGYYGLLSDVTERRAADEALRKNESLMRAIFEHSPVAINLKDTQGRYLLVNRKWESMTGKNMSELRGKTVQNLLPPGLARAYREFETDVLASGQAGEREFVIPTRHGDRTFHVIKFPIIAEDGVISGLGSISTDITERNQALEALAESEERYQGLYDDAPDMYFTVARDGTIRSVNQFGADYLGYLKDELIGSPVMNLIHVDDRSAVKTHLHETFRDSIAESQLEFRKMRKDGSVLWVHERIRLSVENNGAEPELRIVCRDVTEAHHLSEELSFQATHDPLTGLVNRRELEQRLQRVLTTAQSEASEHALCYMDLDQFKVINDTCGHVAGDELLRQLGQVLPTIVRRRDTLARLGGDEFAVLMEHCPLDQAQRVANALRSTVEEFRFGWEDRTFNIGASIGLVPINQDSRSVSDVLSAADTACYMAKDQGRNRIYVYDPSSVELARRHGEMEWVSRIHQALEEDRFELFFQPIRTANAAGSDSLDGAYYELLLRMRGSDDALIYPGAFLPAAERFNLSGRLDRWVVSNTFAKLKANPRHLDSLQQCAINLSGLSLADVEFHRFVMQQFQEFGIPGDKICFEVTETAAIGNLTSATRFIASVKELGGTAALDDFGSGLSSFAYLKHLAVDYLKIDGVFVKDIVDDPIDYAMVKSINEIGQVMGKKTVAEFVENELILEKLRQIGVDFVQGYSIGRPAPFAMLLGGNG